MQALEQILNSEPEGDKPDFHLHSPKDLIEIPQEGEEWQREIGLQWQQNYREEHGNPASQGEEQSTEQRQEWQRDYQQAQKVHSPVQESLQVVAAPHTELAELAMDDMQQEPSYRYYGRGLQWNAHSGRLTNNTISRMNQAAVSDADELFSTFLAQASGTQDGTSQPSWMK